MAGDVYRLLLLPYGGALGQNRDAAFELCTDKSVIGVGWNVGAPAGGRAMTWNQYTALATQVHGQVDPSVQMLHDMKKGDLVWIRSPSVDYYLAEIRGEWEYRWTEIHSAVDILNIRRVDRWFVQTSAVPVVVQNSFIQRSLQRVADPQAVQDTRSLWSTLF